MSETARQPEGETASEVESRESNVGATPASPVVETEGQRPSPLSPEEIERLEALVYEELEEFIEEPTEGPLSIISDQDVPGAPG